MKLKKLVNSLKDCLENKSSLYTDDEVEYMKVHLQFLEGELLKATHKDYKGFGKYETN